MTQPYKHQLKKILNGDSPTTTCKFFVDENYHLRCFFNTGSATKPADIENEKGYNTQCSLVYEKVDQEIKTQALDNALYKFISGLTATSQQSNISAVRFSTNSMFGTDFLGSDQLLRLQFYRENVSFRVAVEHGEKLPIEAKVSGTSGQDVFVSFYLDNQLTPIWDGCDYLQCHVDDTHYTQITGELDTSQLEPGRYLCYTACGNTKDIMSVAPVTAFILEVL